MIMLMRLPNYCYTASENPALPPEKIAGGFLRLRLSASDGQAAGGQKGRGLGGSLPAGRQGIFARLLPFPFRLRKGKAEGGFGAPRSRASSLRGKNSAFPLRNQIEASPATCLNTWKAEHRRKILFSLREKEMDSINSPQVRRAPCLPAGRQNEKSKEYFSVVWRACRAVAGLASLVGVLLKECSNFVQKTPQK